MLIIGILAQASINNWNQSLDFNRIKQNLYPGLKQ